MFTFKIEKDGKYFHAYCPELPGCHTFGKTYPEALEHLKDAMILYLEVEIESQSFPQFLSGTQRHVKA